MTRADVLTDELIDQVVHRVENDLFGRIRVHPESVDILRTVRAALVDLRRPTFTWSVEIRADDLLTARAIMRMMTEPVAGRVDVSWREAE